MNTVIGTIKRHRLRTGAVVVAVLAAVFHTAIWDHLRHYWHQAYVWKISPPIFVGLLVLTIYPYYKGWFQIARGLSARKLELIRAGVIRNRLAWAVPYAYVLAFGRGYPRGLLYGLIGWMSLGLGLFIYHYRKSEYISKATDTRLGRLVGRFVRNP